MVVARYNVHYIVLNSFKMYDFQRIIPCICFYDTNLLVFSQKVLIVTEVNYIHDIEQICFIMARINENKRFVN